MLQNRIKALREARDNGENGFTLIELLIVIVVLGILAGIVVFGVGTFRDDAEDAACGADVKTVNVALSAFNASEPTPIDPATTTAPAAITALEAADYIQDVPTFPAVATWNADNEIDVAC